MPTLPLPGALSAAAAVVSLTAATLGQSSAPFPMESRGLDASSALPVLRGDSAAYRDLASRESVRLTGFPLPDGSLVEFELRRVDLARRGFRFYVDGQPAGDLTEGLELSVWIGDVAGAPGSEALLSFSNRGTRGWIRTEAEFVHLLPRPGVGGDWSASESLVVRERDLIERGAGLGEFCAQNDFAPPSGGQGAEGSPATGAPDPGGSGGCPTWRCEIAVETDFQLFKKFNDLGAETAYVTTLLAAASARYEDQLDTVLAFPYVQLYTTSNDPWSTPESGGNTDAMLAEFQAAWAGAVPGGARLGHFLSGANLGGGVAHTGVLCDTGQNQTFAVSGSLHGKTPFPVVKGPLTYDFVVFCHETGHNFSSPHTHDYAPPIDNCANGQCIANGTLMSYCNQCPGGMSNITTYFQEPTVTTKLKQHASFCLPAFVPIAPTAGSQPELIPPGVPTPLAVELSGTPLGGVELLYRFDAGSSFAALPMALEPDGTWTAALPPASCGDTPQWFFASTTAACGAVQTATYSADVSNVSLFVAEDFETPSTWTVGAQDDDAIAGFWVQGAPNGTLYQPTEDVSDPGTQCWYTGASGGPQGENDVDGGKTTLTTNAYDLSTGDATISYERWFSNLTPPLIGTDTLVVEITNDGATWVQLEKVGLGGSFGQWVHREFLVSDFVAPTASVQVRFVASDQGFPSNVEAAVDEFTVSATGCLHCQQDLGFGGPGTTTLGVCGQVLATGGTADLVLDGAPAGAPAWLAIGAAYQPTHLLGGTLVPVPADVLLAGVTDGSGRWIFPVQGGTGAGFPVTVQLQGLALDLTLPQWFQISNAVAVEFLP